jgi:hypothetical protein
MSGGVVVFKFVIAFWLFLISGATLLSVFLPLVRNGGAMWFEEYNRIILWGEFLFCASGVAIGVLGMVKK